MSSASDSPRSLREDLRAKRSRLGEKRPPKIFDLPGYGEALAVKYRVLDPEEVKEIRGGIATRASAGEDNAVLIGLCSTLARACVGFYTKRGNAYVPLEEAEGLGEGAILWGDERLAELFDLEGEKLRAREIIESVIPDEILIEGHHTRVTMWMEQARGADDADF